MNTEPIILQLPDSTLAESSEVFEVIETKGDKPKIKMNAEDSSAVITRNSGHSLSVYENTLKKCIQDAKSLNAPLKIPAEFLRFHKKLENKHLFDLLLKSDIRFSFFDKNQEINENVISAICEYVNFIEARVKPSEAKKISSNIAFKNPDLNSDIQIKLTGRKKTQKAFFDQNNVVARIKVAFFKQLHLSENKIAENLNQLGLFTPRGNAFHAKQVARLWESYQELEKLYHPHPDEKNLLSVEKRGEGPSPIEKIECTELGNYISILFLNLVNELITVRILDNQKYLCYSRKYQSSRLKNIKIDILEETTLYPGRAYVFIDIGNEISCAEAITIRPDMLLNQAISNNGIPASL